MHLFIPGTRSILCVQIIGKCALQAKRYVTLKKFAVSQNLDVGGLLDDGGLIVDSSSWQTLHHCGLKI